MQLDALAVNAVVQRGRLMEAEGSDEGAHLDCGEGMTVDGSVRIMRYTVVRQFHSRPTIDLCRAMLNELVHEIAVKQSKRADDLVMGLRR